MSSAAADYTVGYLDGLNKSTPLKRWLESNGFLQPGSVQGKPFTHACLNGGTLLIPDDKHEAFLKLYAEDIEQNATWSIHENATRFSRLYFDFDVSEVVSGNHQQQNSSDISPEILTGWATVLQRAAFEFFPDAQHDQISGSVIVLIRPSTYSYKEPSSAPAKMVTIGTGNSVINNFKANDTRDAMNRIAVAEVIRSGVILNPTQCMSVIQTHQHHSTTSSPRHRKSKQQQQQDLVADDDSQNEELEIGNTFDLNLPWTKNEEQTLQTPRAASAPPIIYRGYVQTPVNFNDHQHAFSKDTPYQGYVAASRDPTLTEQNSSTVVETKDQQKQQQQTASSSVCIRKIGAHFIFPNIVCDLNHMLQIRERAVFLFKKHFPHAVGASEWDDIIDIGIYTGNSGLRMPFSQKVETCKACHAGHRKRLKCLECSNRPRVFVPQFYRPVLWLGTDHRHMNDVFTAMTRTVANTMMRCSLRQPTAYQCSFEFVRPESLGEYTGPRIVYTVANPSSENSSWTNSKREELIQGQHHSAPTKKRKTDQSEAKLEPIAQEPNQSLASARRKILFEYGRGEPIVAEIERFLQTRTHAEWRNITVAKVQTLEGRSGSSNHITHTVKVIGDGANFCLNVNREHNSSTVYFTITERGVFQRCFCKKQTLDGRIMGVPCPNFVSQAFALQDSHGTELYNKLFATSLVSRAAQSSNQIREILNFENTPSSEFPSTAELSAYLRKQQQQQTESDQQRLVRTEQKCKRRKSFFGNSDDDDEDGDLETEMQNEPVVKEDEMVTEEQFLEFYKQLNTPGKTLLANIPRPEINTDIVVKLPQQRPTKNIAEYSEMLIECQKKLKKIAEDQVNYILES